MAAVSLGASIIEKHYTDSKSRNGEDIICSMDWRRMQQLIKSTKEIFSIMVELRKEFW